MKITILLMAIIALTSTAQAGYRIVIPMEQSKGGPLPNGSISITPKTPSLPVENWQPAEPLYSEWVNVGDVSGCSNWTPDASTVEGGLSFTQSATGCSQNQTRSIQEREQETTTLAYRSIGEPTIETRKQENLTISRVALGTMTCWSSTTEYSLVIGTNQRLFKISGTFRPTTGSTTDGYYYSGWHYYAGSFIGLVNGENRYKICKRL